MLNALKKHWPEYLMEAAGLGIFMVSASVFTILLYHPASPALRVLPEEFPRRVLMGLAMGLTAISNVCQHQNGPLREGKILDGCITCPWHGYQYVPATGASPPPFVEKVPTFNVRVKNGRVFVHPKPNPPGTHAEPALIESKIATGRQMEPEESEEKSFRSQPSASEP